MGKLFGWMIKLSVLGVIGAVVTGNLEVKVPDTVLGYKVPEGVKRQVESASKIKEYGEQTQGGFKKIGDAIGR